METNIGELFNNRYVYAAIILIERLSAENLGKYGVPTEKQIIQNCEDIEMITKVMSRFTKNKGL